MLFGKTGFIEFGYDKQIAEWAECAKKKSSGILADPAHLQKWLQCEGTWFVELMSYLITQAVTLQMLNYLMFSKALWIKLI